MSGEDKSRPVSTARAVPAVQTGESSVSKVFYPYSFSSPHIYSLIRTEFENQASINHHNLVPYRNITTELNKTTISRQSFFATSLTEHITMYGCCNRQNALNILVQLAEGIEYLHTLGIAAMTVSPDNIFLRKGNRACLVDFGFTAIFSETVSDTGSILACALSGPPGSVVGELELDIFQLGLVFFMMITGHLPWRVYNIPRIATHMSNDEIPIPSNVDQDVRDLLKDMFRCNKSLRLTASEVKSRAMRLMSTETPIAKNLAPRPLNTSISLRSIGEAIALADKETRNEIKAVAQQRSRGMYSRGSVPIVRSRSIGVTPSLSSISSASLSIDSDYFV